MNSFEKLHTENVRAEAEGAILVLRVGAVEPPDGRYRDSSPYRLCYYGGLKTLIGYFAPRSATDAEDSSWLSSNGALLLFQKNHDNPAARYAR
jgi:hypothetical protein